MILNKWLGCHTLNTKFRLRQLKFIQSYHCITIPNEVTSKIFKNGCILFTTTQECNRTGFETIIMVVFDGENITHNALRILKFVLKILLEPISKIVYTNVNTSLVLLLRLPLRFATDSFISFKVASIFK